jgi:uncharacterized membrane protein
VSTDSTQDDGPGVDRTITLTDAVVAIAMTLLILPLVDVSGDLPATGLRDFWSENSDVLTSFVISFVVIYAFWTGHGAIFATLLRSSVEKVSGLSTLNMFWLLGIAFLPFPTALVGREVSTTSAPVYVGTMLAVSALAATMLRKVQRAVDARRTPLDWLSTAVFGVCTAVAFAQPALALYLLLLLIPARILEGRAERSAAITSS